MLRSRHNIDLKAEKKEEEEVETCLASGRNLNNITMRLLVNLFCMAKWSERTRWNCTVSPFWWLMVVSENIQLLLLCSILLHCAALNCVFEFMGFYLGDEIYYYYESRFYVILLWLLAHCTCSADHEWSHEWVWADGEFLKGGCANKWRDSLQVQVILGGSLRFFVIMAGEECRGKCCWLNSFLHVPRLVAVVVVH